MHVSQAEAQAEFKGGELFEISVGQKKFTLEDHGKAESSLSEPTQILLTALLGCAGISLVALLNKREIPFDSLSLKTEAVYAQRRPQVFERGDLSFYLTGVFPAEGSELREKAFRDLQSRVCLVGIMLDKSFPITLHYYLNGEETLTLPSRNAT